MKVKLMKRVFSRLYGASILVTLDMNKQKCYTQLNLIIPALNLFNHIKSKSDYS